MPPLWHYTVANCMIEILKDGMINPATAGVPNGERPAVWFSHADPWEPTANKMLRNPETGEVTPTRGIEEMAAYSPVRIQVDPQMLRLATWNGFRGKSGVSKREAKGLAGAAREIGADPGMWRASFEPARAGAWSKIQVYLNGEWSDIDREQFERQFGGIPSDADLLDSRSEQMEVDLKSPNPLGSLDDFKTAVSGIDCVIGVDNVTGEQALFYGRSNLERCIGEGVGATPLILSLDFSPGAREVEKLCAMLIHVFGSHDLQSG